MAKLTARVSRMTVIDVYKRQVYNIVLACHDKALEITRPGITYMSVHLEVCKVLVQGLKDLGLMKGNVEEAVAAGAHA